MSAGGRKWLALKCRLCKTVCKSERRRFCLVDDCREAAAAAKRYIVLKTREPKSAESAFDVRHWVFGGKITAARSEAKRLQERKTKFQATSPGQRESGPLLAVRVTHTSSVRTIRSGTRKVAWRRSPRPKGPSWYPLPVNAAPSEQKRLANRGMWL